MCVCGSCVSVASGSVLKAKWPSTGDVDGWMSRSFQFLKKTVGTFRVTASKVGHVVAQLCTKVCTDGSHSVLVEFAHLQ